MPGRKPDRPVTSASRGSQNRRLPGSFLFLIFSLPQRISLVLTNSDTQSGNTLSSILNVLEKNGNPEEDHSHFRNNHCHCLLVYDISCATYFLVSHAGFDA